MVSHKKMHERNVLITGAAHGIGLQLALGFARSGARVMMTDINESEVLQRASELELEGFQVTGVRCDVTKESEVKFAVAQAKVEYGGVDVLINNAGIQHVDLIEDFPVEKFEEMIRIMLTGPFMLSKLVIPLMKQQQYGRIINIASINGLIGFAGKAAYNSAKHGLIGLTKVAALEGADDGITANAICPGYVDTAMVRGQFEDLARTRNTTADKVLEEVIFPLVPQKRLIDTEEIVQTALYLCSESAAGITGQSIVIDGGYTVR
ncbi:3-hydroxybutyrate dehydrogenase [Membranicola marinus]|uniref:3-hydroxybutyrate dehydrogenase n=1 Tax=Membranihabitans marinus TaxID=1227546 RepID=A0A953LBZ3_9BACT|nr:3-hydroxybutyrate dehydrogenase [Membranihabitans marinus]MBY5960283.1 3-hydroxybutyrate dehydrogenase [Membranihabitans marinus]